MGAVNLGKPDWTATQIRQTPLLVCSAAVRTRSKDDYYFHIIATREKRAGDVQLCFVAAEECGMLKGTTPSLAKRSFRSFTAVV